MFVRLSGLLYERDLCDSPVGTYWGPACVPCLWARISAYFATAHHRAKAASGRPYGLSPHRVPVGIFRKAHLSHDGPPDLPELAIFAQCSVQENGARAENSSNTLPPAGVSR
ncbi:hypothetical protein CNY67_13590 [Desulfovibrio sp. G11]|nr:hypothetical protein CNY67_13590 [Desulfovibrio sp. G11]